MELKLTQFLIQDPRKGLLKPALILPWILDLLSAVAVRQPLAEMDGFWIPIPPE
jgi:hypothetical protein